MNPFNKYLEQHIMMKGSSKDLWRDPVSFFLTGLCACLSSYVLSGLTNVSFWLVMTVMLVSTTVCIGAGIRIGTLLWGKPELKNPFTNVSIVLCSIMVVVIGLEGFLGWHEQQAVPRKPVKKKDLNSLSLPSDLHLNREDLVNIKKRQQLLTMPVQWERRNASLPGAVSAYYWHDVLHIHDEGRFRRSKPVPQKPIRTFRIMVVGDSLTYGYGIDQKFTYANVIQEELGKDYNVEVINLGVTGYQSQNILAVIRRFLPRYHPDFVIYGVCLNDFLPAGKGEYTGRGYAFPLPDSVQDFLTERTRVARFVSDLYDRSLRTAGLRVDFFEDILQDFDGYQQRFGRDVLAMNQFVTTNGLPPVLALVLDQYPRYGRSGHRIARVAETLLTQAGIDVVKTENFYKRFDGVAMHVSPWEGHPNEMAHAIFASMILKKLHHHPSLNAFRRT